ncbi:hypothetical protein AYI68_g3345 [Smittium mucronatum]|uniref:Uncharacterized protein n=1 Tax=Smittium mucronatum TaxID=133383 RepID=A0A1R0H057_9FUNG|nr:hypothetical protein AYI68_g3345 [Smittium mucronatum]
MLINEVTTSVQEKKVHHITRRGMITDTSIYLELLEEPPLFEEDFFRNQFPDEKYIYSGPMWPGTAAQFSEITATSQNNQAETTLKKLKLHMQK